MMNFFYEFKYLSHKGAAFSSQNLKEKECKAGSFMEKRDQKKNRTGRFCGQVCRLNITPGLFFCNYTDDDLKSK